MTRHPKNHYSASTETVNGWHVVWVGFLLIGDRKRKYAWALCPDCRNLKHKRYDHLRRIKRCAVCWNTKFRGRMIDHATS